MVVDSRQSPHREVSVSELAEMLRDGRAAVVDVREPAEFAAGHIPGAVNMPLSRFEASELSHPAGKMLVLNCLGGKRSGMALDKCGVAQVAIDTHLGGGFDAWKSAGFPIER